MPQRGVMHATSAITVQADCCMDCGASAEALQPVQGDALLPLIAHRRESTLAISLAACYELNAQSAFLRHYAGLTSLED